MAKKFLCEFFVGNTEKYLEIVEAEDKKDAEHQLDLKCCGLVDLVSCEEISEQDAADLKSSGKLRPYVDITLRLF